MAQELSSQDAFVTARVHSRTPGPLWMAVASSFAEAGVDQSLQARQSVFPLGCWKEVLHPWSPEALALSTRRHVSMGSNSKH